ncbi:MAG: signal peptidase II [bacterium]|nr:signal peptidase II [bacterium]
MSVKSRYSKYFGFVLGVIILDVAIKYAVERYLVREFALGFFRIGNYQNPQGLFGLVGITEIILISIIVFGAIAFLIWKSENERERVSLFLIISGGALNLFERITMGFVKDNFAIGNLGYFNFADVVIGVGILLMLFELIKKRKGRTSKERSDLHWRT